MSEPLTLLLLTGGIARGANNRRLARDLLRRTPEGVRVVEADITALPFFSQDLEADPPEPVRALRAELCSADGVIVVTPEYNGGVPGVLKNAVDWASRPHSAERWADKPVGLLGATTGRSRTLSARRHLRGVLIRLDALPMPVRVRDGYRVSEDWSADGTLTPEAAHRLDAFWRELMRRVRGTKT